MDFKAGLPPAPPDFVQPVGLSFAWSPPALPPRPTFRHPDPPSQLPISTGDHVPPETPLPSHPVNPAFNQALTGEATSAPSTDADSTEVSIAAWDEQREDTYGDVAGKDWLAKRRAEVDAKLARLENALHAAPADDVDYEEPLDDQDPLSAAASDVQDAAAALEDAQASGDADAIAAAASKLATKQELVASLSPAPAPEAVDHFLPVSPQKAYESACEARGAATTAKDLRKSSMPKGPVETKLYLLQSDLTQHINFGPVKFRQLEDEVLALQHALVNEIKSRKSIGLELNEQRDWLYEQYHTQLQGFSEQGSLRMDDLWAAAEGRVEQCAEKVLKLGLRKDMQLWEEAMDDKVNVLAKEVAVQVTEETENRTRALHNFEATLKARYTGIQDELLKNRKDRAQTEDLLMGFLDKLAHHESLADCKHLFKLKVKA